MRMMNRKRTLVDAGLTYLYVIFPLGNKVLRLIPE
jgi:hypothetical protein